MKREITLDVATRMNLITAETCEDGKKQVIAQLD